MQLLKHNRKHAAKPADVHESYENLLKPSYAQVTPRTPLKRPSLTNKSAHERLRSSSRSNCYRKQGILKFMNHGI